MVGIGGSCAVISDWCEKAKFEAVPRKLGDATWSAISTHASRTYGVVSTVVASGLVSVQPSVVGHVRQLV